MQLDMHVLGLVTKARWVPGLQLDMHKLGLVTKARWAGG